MAKNIWIAASDGDLDRVKELIEGGTSANAKDENSYTPMHAAASWGHPDVLDYLISKGGDINLRDGDGETPLFAVETIAMATKVISLGADASLRNEQGRTAAASLAEDYYPVARYVASITKETLPVTAADSDEEEEENAGAGTKRSAPSRDSAAPLSIDSLPAETSAQTDAAAEDLMAKIRDITIAAERDGFDPEDQIREAVNAAVALQMREGQRLAYEEAISTGQLSADGTPKKIKVDTPGR
ncbi:uncharacterized protein L969DRAFT_92147 [Mixia osmundae IAM 14324]|uniref:Uncharacterized protein n=1 Tax=Mixia osmundae (strain CBS 9802 / IAM 14324 / JCM 22182 / KY 12970) TaxID=764103 RepID=G7DT68_MIXOS|nr:uncharacterized protein L969DRAFT_92147 [Mixia osmundae IAM 14324]KEI42719.1 hypothetical protein L969DRAFT_92147 [Mixia osmundae IAM 14324]GAA93947.1 hypothetical protein E5Q_00593 [Mixia osmundae IAM 14324]